MLQAVFTCDICKKTEIFSGSDAVSKSSYKPWQPIPDKNKFGWDDNYNGRFNPFAHEWICSMDCVEKWVDSDPKHRALYLEEDYDCIMQQYPIYITQRTRNHVRLCVHRLRFRLSDGKWVAGGYHNRCEGKLREKDRLRLLQNR